MSDVALQVDGVWKKFRKGEFHDSLRDLIPAVTKGLLRRGIKKQDLEDQEFWALRDVSFEIKRGDSLGIIGPNGAGKSTMLKVLSKILKPNRGSYRTEGRVSSLIEVGAGFHADLTGRENIYLNGAILGMPKKVVKDKEEQIIEFAGVREFIETPLKRYSSGMRARLGFSVAAHMEPDILLVDEVLSVGDPRFRQKCIRHMRELIQSDVTVVFISHLLDQVKALCPNTVVLDKGEVKFNGPTDEACRKYLEILDQAGDAPSEQDQSQVAAEVRNIRLIDAGGQNTLRWQAGQPGTITCELLIREAAKHPTIVIDMFTIEGNYMLTASSRLKTEEPVARPGVYKVRFTFKHVPVNRGDYYLNFKVNGGDNHECISLVGQPRAVTVDGTAGSGYVWFDGNWEMTPISGEKSSTTLPHTAEVI